MKPILRPLRKCSPETVRGIAEHQARLRFLRTRRSLGLTQASLASELGCSVDSVELWEGGKARVPAWVFETEVMRAARKVGG